MKRLQWMLEVADKKPLLFSILLLLVAVGVLAQVVKERNNRLLECENDSRAIERVYSVKADSLQSYYMNRETQHNEELKTVLNSIIADYKNQIEEQKKLNDRVNSTISKNRTIIKTFRR